MAKRWRGNGRRWTSFIPSPFSAARAGRSTSTRACSWRSPHRRSPHAELLGEYAERQSAQREVLIFGFAAALLILLLLRLSFGGWRPALLSYFTLPSALVGGVLATFAAGRIISLGTLVGFLTVLGIAARNGILLISHYRHLEQHEGETFGATLVMRGSRDRLSPILMTTLATALALVPLVVLGDIPGHEIEHPTAVVIVGGLITSTLLNLFIVPVLYLRFGRSATTMPQHGKGEGVIDETPAMEGR